MSTDRPDPDTLLAKVQAEEAKQARGRLKIFFGMAPGVGKTYAMLEAARKIGKEGVDVVVGYVEPHARPETHALVMGLDLLPRRAIPRGGATLYEFDLEAALARKPQLILVDELAHTNAEGSTHAKRWQDIEDLLAAGIDVYTSLNVQHLESLNDIVAQVTSIPVRETVPDQVFENADEIELVDLAPDDLIERLQEGKVYLPVQARRAIENFFRKGNLIALRELALRKTAERVNAQALDWRQANAIDRIWPTSERLLVCVGSSPLSAKLVRGARRMAASLRAPWIALHVEVEGRPTVRPSDQLRLEHNLRLAEELGGKVDTVAADEFAAGVLRYARERNVTKIVVGKPQQSRWRDLWRGPLVDELIRRSQDIDVYVISGDDEDRTSSSGAAPAPHGAADPTAETEERDRRPYLWSAVAIAACTALCWPLSPFLAPTNLAMLYLATVLAVALTCGRGPSILATVLGVAAFDIAFVPPHGTFAVTDTQYLLTFLVMLATGIVVSELAARVRAQRQSALRRERTTAALYQLSRELTNLPTMEAVARMARRIIGKALDGDVWIILPEGSDGGPDQGRRFASADPSPGAAAPLRDEGVVRWVYEHKRPAGHGTDTLPGGEATYLPLLGTDGIVGVLGLKPHRVVQETRAEQRRLLQAFAGQVAGAVERCGLARQAERIRLQMETERMRNALLSAVSHDLRTPLATITGAASILVDENAGVSESNRRELASSIVDEADRLNRLVANLLDLTRLEGGAIQLHRDLQPVDEVIEVSLARLERQLREHTVSTHVAPDLPPVAIDGLLVQQVLVNLLDNASKFAPAGTPIELSAFKEGSELVIEVADRGPGIPSGEEERIFDKFYRASGQQQRGSGIGLAICRGIVELHGGRISAGNRPGSGAIFRVSFPIPAAAVRTPAPSSS